MDKLPRRSIQFIIFHTLERAIDFTQFVPQNQIGLNKIAPYKNVKTAEFALWSVEDVGSITIFDFIKLPRG